MENKLCKKHGYYLCPHCPYEPKSLYNSIPKEKPKVMKYKTIGANRIYYWE